MKNLIPFLLVLLPACLLGARDFSEGPPCAECPPAYIFNSADSTMDVLMADGTVLRNCRSARRLTWPGPRGPRQAVRLGFLRGEECFDTVVAVTAVREYQTSGIGGRGVPQTVAVRPVREFFRELAEEAPTGLFDITLVGGYAGADESTRSIGFEQAYGGAELLYGGSIGELFGNNFSLAGGVGALLEGGRLRLPLLAHGRLSFAAAPRVVETAVYKPEACNYFNGAAVPTGHLAEQGFVEEAVGGEVDSTAYLEKKREVRQSDFRPFLFLEAGYIVDGGFEGSGSEPSINSGDYNLPLLLGAGLGLPFGDWGTISVGYRMLRLNLRTDCPECIGRFVLNNNDIHSVIIKFGRAFR